jgi:Nif11 domain
LGKSFQLLLADVGLNNHQVRLKVSKQVEQFHQMVLDNQSLREQLKAASNAESFFRLAVLLGQQYGYSFTHREVEAYVNQNFLTIMRQFS